MHPLRRELRQEYQRKWIVERRREYFEDKKCVRCKATTDLVHHYVDREIKRMTNIWSHCKEIRDEELKKCIILCESCRILERNPLKHGVAGTYKDRGCRCVLCTEAARVALKTYRDEKRKLK
jgi:hypothetical protein